MTTITWDQASARRLARNHLADPRSETDCAVICADVLAVHAQVMSAAELSIGLRGSGISKADVQAALWEKRTLVKTRGPRGTVHLLAAADLPMWTGALSAVPAGDVRQMTPEQVEQVVAAIADAVASSELTVDELTDAIVERVGPWAGDRVMDAFQDKWPRWRQAEAVATSRGAMCFGPVRERRATYTSPSRWLPDFRAMPAEEALSSLVRRYLHGYGPGTAAGFAKWLGVSPAWAAAVFARQDGLRAVSFMGEPAWDTPGDASSGRAPVRLLPYFDAYAIAGQPRASLFPGRAAERALNRGQAGNNPVLVVDGIVAGVWQMKRSGRRAAVTVEPFAELTAEQDEHLTNEVVRIGAVLGTEVTRTIGTVTAGPHA